MFTEREGTEVRIFRHERTLLVPHEYLGKYDRWMQSAGHSPRTIKQRLRMAAWVLEQWPDPGKPSAADILDWLGSMRKKDGRPLARWTKATYHGNVRAFFEWLANADHIHEDPMASKLVKRPKTRNSIPKPLSAAEEERALAHAHDNVRAWLLLALRAGLRASEIAAFRGEWISEDFIIWRGKGDVEAAIPTHPELWALAQTYPRRGWWFPSPEHDGHIAGNSVTVLVGRHFRSPDVDIPSGSIHRCRHSYATDLVRRGVNLKRVQTLMRHSSLTTTSGYAAVDEDELRAAINLLGPSHPAA
jgi:integrase/recombinase XerD